MSFPFFFKKKEVIFTFEQTILTFLLSLINT